MNFGQLKTAILAQSHRENYAADAALFVSEGEGKIASKLDGYILSKSLLDVDKSAANVYILPTSLSVMRNVYYLRDLTQVDISTARTNSSNSVVSMYVMRGSTIFVAGNTPVAAQVDIEYYGMPTALSLDTDTNSLLNEYPQLYIQAAQIFVYQKSQNWQASATMESAVDALIRDINRRTRKKLGGAQSATPYNVNFRSSY